MIRRGRPWAGALLCAWCGIAVVAACGGSEDVVRAPEAAKVVWGGGEASAEAPAAEETAEPAAEEEASAPKPKEPGAAPKASEDSEEEAALAAGAIDLDAPSAAPARAEEPARSEEKEAKPSRRARGSKARSSKVAAAKAAAAEKEKEEESAPEAPAAEPSPDAPPPLAELQRRRNQREKEEGKEKKETEKKSEAAPEPAASAYKGAEPCRASSFTIARVRTACENGGRPGAKRVMKDAINKATATGQLLKCADCHSSMSDYSLKSDAVDKLQRWLDGSG